MLKVARGEHAYNVIFSTGKFVFILKTDGTKNIFKTNKFMPLSGYSTRPQNLARCVSTPAVPDSFSQVNVLCSNGRLAGDFRSFATTQISITCCFPVERTKLQISLGKTAQLTRSYCTDLGHGVFCYNTDVVLA